MKAKNTIKSLLVNSLYVTIATCFSVSAIAASKDTATGEVKTNAAKESSMAKAPENAAFKSLDADADGKISQKESSKDAALAAKFTSTDANKDGAITVAEYAKYQSEKATTTN